MRKMRNSNFSKKNLNNVEKSILYLFYDSSLRPKKTPRHEMVILVKLEEEHSPWRVKTALRNLEKKNILNNMKKKILGLGTVKFYFLKNMKDESTQDIQKKINVTIKWIKKYSDNKKRTMVGQHLHDVVKAEIRAHGFEIIGEHTNEFNGKKWKNN